MLTLIVASLMTMTDAGDDWRARVEAVLAAHRAQYAGWKLHTPPPRPSLVELALPEPVLAGCLDAKPGTCPGTADLYLTALAKKGTATSAQLVFDWARQQSYPYQAWWLLAEHAPVDTLLALQPRDPARGTQSLAYALAMVRKQRLPDDARARLYDELRAQVGRPANGDPDSLWKALHALEPARARDELAGMLGDGTDISVLFGLRWEPRPERAAVRDALTKLAAGGAPGVDRALFNEVLLENLGDAALPALKTWLAKNAKKGASVEPVKRLLSFVSRAPAAPGLDAWLPALVRDERLPEYERWEVLRTVRARALPDAKALDAWWKSKKRCCD